MRGGAFPAKIYYDIYKAIKTFKNLPSASEPHVVKAGSVLADGGPAAMTMCFTQFSWHTKFGQELPPWRQSHRNRQFAWRSGLTVQEGVWLKMTQTSPRCSSSSQICQPFRAGLFARICTMLKPMVDRFFVNRNQRSPSLIHAFQALLRARRRTTNPSWASSREAYSLISTACKKHPWWKSDNEKQGLFSILCWRANNAKVIEAIMIKSHNEKPRTEPGSQARCLPGVARARRIAEA